MDTYNRAASHFGELYLKYTPAILEYGSTATGLGGYAFPPLGWISAGLKMLSIGLKADNPYYQIEDIPGDIIGLFVGLRDPITGELLNITIDEALKKNYLIETNLKNIKNYSHHQQDINYGNQQKKDDSRDRNYSNNSNNNNDKKLPNFKRWMNEDVWQDEDGNFHLR